MHRTTKGENGMLKGLQRHGIVRRNKMIREGIRLFLEDGYTSATSIATALQMNITSSPRSKDFDALGEIFRKRDAGC